MKKLEFYEHLRSLGIKEKKALSMAKQSENGGGKANGWGRTNYTNAAQAVLGFMTWSRTEEGTEYWNKMHDKELAKQDTRSSDRSFD